MVSDIGAEFTRMGGLMDTETQAAVAKTTTAFGGLSGTLGTIADTELGSVVDKFKDLGISLPAELQGLADKVGEKWGRVLAVLQAPSTFEGIKRDWVDFFDALADGQGVELGRSGGIIAERAVHVEEDRGPARRGEGGGREASEQRATGNGASTAV